MERARLMGYVLSILMNALQTWLFTKLWDSFFTRRFSGKAFWAYWVIWTAAITVYVNILQNDFRYRYAVDFVMELVLFYGMCLTLYCGRWDRRLLYWFGISTHRRRKTESRAHGYRHQHCSHCVHCLCFTGCSTQKVPQAKMTHGRFACL